MQELKNRYKTFIIISFTNDLSFFYYQSIKNYHESLKVALSSLEEVKVQNDKFSLFQTYQNIGTAYLLLNNYENSIHWLKSKRFRICLLKILNLLVFYLPVYSIYQLY
jgi:hypothetical protein